MRNQRAALPWRARLLGATSLVCLALLAAEPVRAADVAIPTKAPAKAPASFYERFYISLEGGYLINSSPANLDFGPVLNALEPLKPGGNGGMAGVTVGGAIDPAWDWRLGWHGNWLNNTTSTAVAPTGFSTLVSASDRLSFQTLDADIGFRIPSAPALRWFVGARVLNAKNDIDYSDRDAFKLGNFAHRTELWGAGPRGGLEATVPLDSHAFLTMMGAGSVIFSHRSEDFNYAFANNGPTGSGTPTFNRSLTVYNLEGSAALGYRLNADASVQLGYRVQQWWNLAPQVAGATNDGLFTPGEKDVLVHGPFAKITVALP